MLSYPCYSDFDPTLLVRECGKMEVLDRLLVKLHATGHRVLLFSTMTKARQLTEHPDPDPNPSHYPTLNPNPTLTLTHIPTLLLTPALT